MKKIKLGYEIGTGEEVFIEPSHMIVTGLTQEAGKTTTLEALIHRSKKRAIVFRTKIGEKSFLEGNIIPPYFKDRSDWQFIEALVEATMREKMKWERATIIRISKKTGDSLIEFKKGVDEELLNPKIRSFERDILTNLQAYLELVLPKLQSVRFSNTLDMGDGLNIIDMERFSRDQEVQSLIIQSVADEILNTYKDVILIIPEAWKFLPQKRGNPCKLIIEEFIRQGAANNNFIWIDSQDMTNVDKVPLKQISTWILGYQREINEVKRTLEQIPLPKSSKPNPDDITGLGTGVFYLATREKTVKVYVQPYWLTDEKARDVAMGKIKVEELDAPQKVAPFRIVKQTEGPHQSEAIDFTETSKRFNKELNEMRQDFFNKIGDLQEMMGKLYTEMYKRIDTLDTQMYNEEDMISKVLQKMPTNNVYGTSPVDQVNIVEQVLKRIPKQAGSITYEVLPVEKIKKEFLEEAKQKILSDIETISDGSKKLLKYLETRNVDITNKEAVEKLFHLKAGGNTATKISNYFKELLNIEVAESTPGKRYKTRLKTRIKYLMGVHEASDQETENVYNHIMMEMLQ